MPNLVCADSGHEVERVMVTRQELMRDCQVLTAAEAQIETEAVGRDVAAIAVYKGMAPLVAMEARQL